MRVEFCTCSNMFVIKTEYYKQLSFSCLKIFYYLFNSLLQQHYYFYELIEGVYTRSYVEYHQNVCYLLQHDKIIGAVFRAVIMKENPDSPLLKPCPYPVVSYKKYFWTCSLLPSAFFVLGPSTRSNYFHATIIRQRIHST